MQTSSITRRLAYLLLLGILSCGDTQLEPAAPPLESPTRAATTEDAPLIIFLGDSITAGLHHNPSDAFPAVLCELLQARGNTLRLINAGVSGDTTAGGLRRIDWLLKQEPEWVVVELGGNDGLRGVAIESIAENLRAILERVLASGAKPILLGVRVPPNYGKEYSEAFEALYSRIASELELPFVSFFMDGVAGVPELNLPDGLHPTREGHSKIAEHLLPTFQVLLGGEKP